MAHVFANTMVLQANSVLCWMTLPVRSLHRQGNGRSNMFLSWLNSYIFRWNQVCCDILNSNLCIPLVYSEDVCQFCFAFIWCNCSLPKKNSDPRLLNCINKLFSESDIIFKCFAVHFPEPDLVLLSDIVCLMFTNVYHVYRHNLGKWFNYSNVFGA